MNKLSTVHFHEQVQAGIENDSEFLEEIVAGLQQPAKQLSPKFFYDERGSELFTEITRQPEYYPTRVETGLLEKHADEIRALTGSGAVLVEYGSGSSEKIRILLDHLRPDIYVPVDISRDYLASAAESLVAGFPWLEVHATYADFTGDFDLPFESDKRRIAFFPGSSIGNFDRTEARMFIKRVRRLVGDNGGLLIGVDTKKDIDILNRAYNDEAGVTAAFNLNILAHLNREYAADFDLDAFEHQAGFNAAEGCIQMFLVSQSDQTVNINGTLIQFQAGEKIHTENSHKYTPEEVHSLAEEGGFSAVESWFDEESLFGLYYFHQVTS